LWAKRLSSGGDPGLGGDLNRGRIQSFPHLPPFFGKFLKNFAI
jgi:hypothetical protein